MADDDEKARDMEGDRNTNRNKREMEEENGEEIKTPSGQDPKKQEMDEVLVSSEATAKENTTKEIEGTEEKDTKDNNLNTTGNTPVSQKDPTQQEMKGTTNPTGGILLFDVRRIKRKKKDKTNTSTIGAMVKSEMEEEQEHEGGNTAMTSLSTELKTEDDNDDDESIVANQYVQDEDEYTVLFHTTKLGLDFKTGGGRKGVVVVSKVSNEEFKHIISLNDIVISIDTIRLTSTTVLKDFFSLIGSSKRPLLIRFSRAEAAKKTVQNRKKRDNKKKKKQKEMEGRMKVIRN